MTLHLKRINGFSSGNGGGGGGSVEVLHRGFFVGDDTTYSTYSGENNNTYKGKSCQKIDDNNYIYYSSSNPGGGSNTLSILSSNYNGTTKNYVSLSFGQTYSSGPTMWQITAVSPNKDIVALKGINNNTNVFAIPLIKNGNDYSFGTPTSLDVGSTPIDKTICFCKDNVFVVAIGSNLNAYQYQNGEISFVKTISLSSTPTVVRSYNGKLIIGYSSKIEIMDYETEEVLFTENVSMSSGYITIYKNFMLYGEYNALNLTTLVKINIDGTLQSSNVPDRNDDFMEGQGNTNNIFVAPNSTIPVNIDFDKGTKNNAPAFGDKVFVGSNNTFLINNRLRLSYSYTGTYKNIFCDFVDYPSYIIYEDYIYQIFGKVAEA